MNPVTLDELRRFSLAVRVGRGWRNAAAVAQHFGLRMR